MTPNPFFGPFFPPLTRVSKTRAWGPRKEGLGERLAEKFSKGFAEGWAKGGHRVGEGLAKGWHVSLHPPIFRFPKRPFIRAGLWLHGICLAACNYVFTEDAFTTSEDAKWPQSQQHGTVSMTVCDSP